ncbi:nitronate monooxygenase [Pseudarthrobacter sp. J75]|uniref:nitronate monooxygenase n=1 Tax=unclassified Pseudarthrobacter TaxID=2647000 RepID=UPI002E821748|nr:MULTISPECIES: nitronate monooxygenase [unclassified Pseudarthrobacter]MEE2522080.1 nitronate monooxygenase [Pseudarthrobacter sp. J47]MEE2529005.1 nitronate monooxygenase [Pseudarthrobacter sp. J75]
MPGPTNIDLLDQLQRPVIQAPMAGGPSTPELAAAVSLAGGLGFLAAGYKTAAQVEAEMLRTRALTDAAFGVNLFVPQPSFADAGQLARYAAELAVDAARYGVEPGGPRFDQDDWDAKLDVVVKLRPAVVSFTFDIPEPSAVSRMYDAGIPVIMTVTSVGEALAAVDAGADALCVQGPEAGGHRGMFEPTAAPDGTPLESLLPQVLGAVQVPVIAAGGIVSRGDATRVLGMGAVAVQCGTAFLLAAEAGTRPAHRAALASPDFTHTGVTRAFSGRYARGLYNRFMADHDDSAPAGYPEVHHMTTPIRAAAAAAGDPHGVNLWAGTGHRRTLEGTAAEILDSLSPAKPGTD